MATAKEEMQSLIFYRWISSDPANARKPATGTAGLPKISTRSR
jgi:hypothetical protein